MPTVRQAVFVRLLRSGFGLILSDLKIDVTATLTYIVFTSKDTRLGRNFRNSTPRRARGVRRPYMKRILAITGLFALVLGMGMVSAAPSNFSGTWALDKSRSGELPRQLQNADIVWEVKQDDKQITVISPAMGGQQTAVFNLDGSETMANVEGRFPGKAARKAKWMNEGKTLELNTVLNANFQGNDVTITTVEHWELADDGKTLKVHRATESPRGKNEISLVFTKK